MNNKRAGAGVGVLDGYIYAVGRRLVIGTSKLREELDKMFIPLYIINYYMFDYLILIHNSILGQ